VLLNGGDRRQIVEKSKALPRINADERGSITSLF
jgi:hypothetical protein